MISACYDIPRKPEWGQRNYKDIVRNRYWFTESLPFSIVNYPECYGTWILFQEAEETQPLLCDCQREAALQFLRINAQNEIYHLAPGQSLIDHFIPSRLRSCNHLQAFSIEEFGDLPFFKTNICHICNRRVPSIRWSNNDGCSIFRQHLGWYLHHALLAAGVSPFGFLLRDELDPELAALVEVDPADGYRRVRDLLAGRSQEEREQARMLNQALNRQNRRIRCLVEERVRRNLGFPQHGKTGGSEIFLRWIVAALFQGQDLHFRIRPDFLHGLELDIYIPKMRLAIEYQGQQHFEPFEHLGGEDHLRSVIGRDKRKAFLCEQEGVKLIYFTIADKLTEDFVRERLALKSAVG